MWWVWGAGFFFFNICFPEKTERLTYPTLRKLFKALEYRNDSTLRRQLATRIKGIL